MNLVADENLDKSLVERLRDQGHDVVYVVDLEPGVDDASVLRLANERGALLVTEDKDFGELVFRQRLIHAGVILVRLAGIAPATKAEIVAKLLAEHGSEMPGAFSVIAPGVLRIRHDLD